MDKLRKMIGGEMPEKKGVVKHQSEKLVDKAKPEEPKAETPKQETIKLGIDNHLVQSYDVPVGDKKYRIENVNRGGSEVPKDKEEEIRKAAKYRGYALVEVE